MVETARTPVPQQAQAADAADVVDGDATVTDADVDRAKASWKELAPERYRGLVEAKEYKGKSK